MRAGLRRCVLLAVALGCVGVPISLRMVEVHAATSAHLPGIAYRQQHSLSCESAALHIALAEHGLDVSENWLQGQYGTDLRPPITSGGRVVTWGNPYSSFVGNVDGVMASTGYGVYESRVVVAAHRAGVAAWAGENWNPADLYAEVARGNPVVVWVPWSLEPPWVQTISTWDGRVVWFSGQEHAQTLIGFDTSVGTVTLSDPLSGTIRTFSMPLFEQRFAQFHGSAVVVGSSNRAAALAVKGSDQGLWVTSGWGWTPLGGQLAAPPAVVREEDGTTLYIVTGTDAALWIRGDDFDWRPLASASACRSGPGAAVGGGVLVVGCRGTDDALWVGRVLLRPGAVPVVPGFASMGGVLSSAPALAMMAGQATYMVSAPPSPAAPGAVWMRNDASGWARTAFSCVDTPALAAQDGAVLFACHGSDDAVWYGLAQGSVPSGARSAGGVVHAGVGAAPVQAGFAVAAEGSGGAVWQTLVVGGAAESWQAENGVALGGARAG